MPISVQHNRLTGKQENVDAWAPGDKEPEKRNLIKWFEI